jgi:TRAP-type C4-dicarboxylate transport system permease small subunit
MSVAEHVEAVRMDASDQPAVARSASRLERGADAVAFLVERLLAVGLIVGIGLNFANVVGRYVAGFALNGVDEIEIYILIAIAFLGAAIVTWRGQHLRMDVLLGACPPVVRNSVALIEMGVLAAIALFVAVQSFRYVERIYALGAVSDIAGVPTWLPHSTVFLGFAAMVLIVIIRGVCKLFRPRSAAPHQASKSEPRP